MKVLVTGGTGYLGRKLVEALAAAGHTPVVFARHATTSGLPGTLVTGDIRDEAGLGAAMSGCEAVLHAAALVAIWRADPREFDEVNVEAFRGMLRAAARAGVSRIVYVSSFLALPPAGRSTPLSSNDYQRTKVAARGEALRAIERGVPLICTYPGVVYGPGVSTEGNLVGRLIADHLAGRLPGLFGSDRRWSYAYVDDVARGHVLALEQGRIGGHYRFGGENVPQRRVFELVRELTGRPLPRDIPLWLGRVLGTLDERRAAWFGSPPRLTRGTVDIFEQDWSLDSSLAIEELGYTITPLGVGVGVTLAGLSPTA